MPATVQAALGSVSLPEQEGVAPCLSLKGDTWVSLFLWCEGVFAGAATAFLPDQLTVFGEVPLEKGVCGFWQTLPERCFTMKSYKTMKASPSTVS